MIMVSRQSDCLLKNDALVLGTAFQSNATTGPRIEL